MQMEALRLSLRRFDAEKRTVLTDRQKHHKRKTTISSV